VANSVENGLFTERIASYRWQNKMSASSSSTDTPVAAGQRRTSWIEMKSDDPLCAEFGGISLEVPRTSLRSAEHLLHIPHLQRVIDGIESESDEEEDGTAVVHHQESSVIFTQEANPYQKFINKWWQRTNGRNKGKQAVLRSGDRAWDKTYRLDPVALDLFMNEQGVYSLNSDRVVQIGCNGCIFAIRAFSLICVRAIWTCSQIDSKVQATLYASGDPMEKALKSDQSWRRLSKCTFTKKHQLKRMALERMDENGRMVSSPLMLMPGATQLLYIHNTRSDRGVAADVTDQQVSAADDHLEIKAGVCSYSTSLIDPGFQSNMRAHFVGKIEYELVDKDYTFVRETSTGRVYDFVDNLSGEFYDCNERKEEYHKASRQACDKAKDWIETNRVTKFAFTEEDENAIASLPEEDGKARKKAEAEA
jgi:hypothetical protein